MEGVKADLRFSEKLIALKCSNSLRIRRDWIREHPELVFLLPVKK